MLLAQIPDPSNVIDTASHYSWEAGLLAFLIIAGVLGLGYGAWHVAWYMVHAVFGDASKQTKGLAGEWVANELAWRGELTKQIGAQTECTQRQTERLEKQTEACSLHVDTVRAMAESLTQQIDAANLAREAAAAAALAASENKDSITNINEILKGRTDIIHETAEGVRQLKGCVFNMCDLCTMFVAKEFPNSAADVSAYMLAVKKKVNEEA